MVAELPSNIITLEEDDDYVNILVYGPSGVGKTVLAGSGGDPKNGGLRTLFIAPEDAGTLSAKRRGSKADKWPVKSWSDLQAAFAWLDQNPDHPFDWIVIDSLTDMQQILLRHILDTIVEKNEDRDPDIPAVQDHQKWQNQFKRFVKAFNALPVNVLWTALPMTATNPQGEEFVTPDLQGKGYQISQTIASFMTSYGYMETRTIMYKNPKYGQEGEPEKIAKEGRVITWKDTGVIRGKDRTDRLQPRTIDKTLVDLHNLITGERRGLGKPAEKPAEKPVEKPKAAPDKPAPTTTTTVTELNTEKESV